MKDEPLMRGDGVPDLREGLRKRECALVRSKEHLRDVLGRTTEDTK